MVKRSRRRAGRPTVKLTERERTILIFRYANPDFTAQQFNANLLLRPGELARILRLKEGRELLDSLIANFTPPDLWPEYRLPGAPPWSSPLFPDAREQG